MPDQSTCLDHVLDPAVRVLLDDRLDPDQRLHLQHKTQSAASLTATTRTPAEAAGH